MTKHSGNHVYLALILAIVAAVSSSPRADGIYQRVSQMMLANSGMEAGIDVDAATEAPENFAP